MGVVLKLPNGNYMLWSTVGEGPISYGLPLREFETLWRDLYGSEGMKQWVDTLRKVEKWGSSSPGSSAEKIMSMNSAGRGGAELTFQEIMAQFGEFPEDEEENSAEVDSESILIDALRAAEKALVSSSDVVVFPCGGDNEQSRALKKVRQAIAKYEADHEGK